jgi:hypothetical protein
LAQATSAEEHPQAKSYRRPEKIQAVGMADFRTPQGPGRKLSECIAIAKAYEEELGYAPVPDADFAADVQAAVDAHRKPLNPPACD